METKFILHGEIILDVLDAITGGYAAMILDEDGQPQIVEKANCIITSEENN